MDNQVPECMQHVRDNVYKCTKYGWEITVNTLPVFCNACDKPAVQLPSFGAQVVHFSKAVVKHALDGFGKVDNDELKRRLDICEKCELRLVNQCSVCGCYLAEKASWRSERCDKGKWDLVQTSGDFGVINNE